MSRCVFVSLLPFLCLYACDQVKDSTEKVQEKIDKTKKEISHQINEEVRDYVMDTWNYLLTDSSEVDTNRPEQITPIKYTDSRLKGYVKQIVLQTEDTVLQKIDQSFYLDTVDKLNLIRLPLNFPYSLFYTDKEWGYGKLYLEVYKYSALPYPNIKEWYVDGIDLLWLHENHLVVRSIYKADELWWMSSMLDYTYIIIDLNTHHQFSFKTESKLIEKMQTITSSKINLMPWEVFIKWYRQY